MAAIVAVIMIIPANIILEFFLLLLLIVSLLFLQIILRIGIYLLSDETESEFLKLLSALPLLLLLSFDFAGSF